MNWTDRGLVLGLRTHGEAAALVELMTRDHGRHLGLVHGARSRRLRPVLQPGNVVEATWRARLDEHLGTYAIEVEAFRAARLIASPLALLGLAALASHLRLLAERDPHPTLFEAADHVAGRLDDPAAAPELLARFELLLLAELGFGLDLTCCAGTGARHDLAYVSPKSGRAVGREAGEPYRERLLNLPGFLRHEEGHAPPSPEAVADGFRLTGFFLEAHLYGPRLLPLPDERARFVALAARGGEGRRSANLDEVAGEPPDSGRDGAP